MTTEQLKREIRANIYENSNGHITGQILQDVLLDMATRMDDIEGVRGQDGEDGNGIRNITTASTSTGVNITINTDTFSKSFSLRNGRDGVDGAAGRDGRDGIDGQPGQDGKDGRDGANGRDGRDGRNGTDGQDGRDGVQGPAGTSGGAGSQGPKGNDGAKGAQGLRGIQGPAGGGGYGDQGLFDSLERELQEYKEEVSGRLASISSMISSNASQAVADALSNLNLTAESMNQLRSALNQAAADAQEALNKVRALSGITGGGEIDPEALMDALAGIQQCQDWINNVSGGVYTMLSDYNDGKAGLIGQGYNVSRGMFTWFGESINALSGTVGTVRRDMDGSQGLIRDIATWYNENEHSFTSAWTAIDAANSRIDNVVEYATESAVTQAITSIDGRLGEISQMIESMSGFSGEIITQLSQRMDGIQGSITQTINRQNGLSGAVVNIGTRMDGVQGSVATAVTVANSALDKATYMSDTWNTASGQLRTVADLTINRDSNGDPIFYYIASGQTNKVRVYYRGRDSQGKNWFSTSKTASTPKYTDFVYPDYMTGAFSYLNQKANSIEMAVSSGDVLAAFAMQATPDGSKINMTADRVFMDSDVFAKAISAKTANMGGIKMGYGVISAGTRSGDYWELKENGTGTFTGNINAKSLTLGQGVTIPGAVTEDQVNTMMRNAAAASGWGVTDGGDYVVVDNWLSSSTLGTKFKVDKNGLLMANNAIISGSVYATNGYFAGTIEGSQIIVGSGSIKLGNGTSNTFEISAGDISVDYTPQTYFTDAYDNFVNTYYQSFVSGFTSGVLGVTGTTAPVTIPSITATTSWNSTPESTPTYEIYTFITSGTSWAGLEYGSENGMNGITPPTPSQCVAYTSTTVSNLNWVSWPSLTKTLNGNTTTAGKAYYWGYVWKLSNYGYGNTPQVRIIIPRGKVTMVASTASDTQYLRIGSNGIQIFLGDGFYFTAAKDPSQGPVISFAGRVNGTMKYFKIDKNGVVMPNE